jgi:hypothetical protein
MLLWLYFDEAINKLDGLAIVGFNLKPDQRRALEELHTYGLRYVPHSFGKTIVFTGYHTLPKPEARALTIIISPLKAIESGQAADLWKLGSNYRPFVVVGETNTPENRDIALGKSSLLDRKDVYGLSRNPYMCVFPKGDITTVFWSLVSPTTTKG